MSVSPDKRTTLPIPRPMPAHRAPASELGKLLNAVRQPVYVLDEELTVVFVNRACREWLGPGVRRARRQGPCVYNSGQDAVGVDRYRGGGLCPPPKVLDGRGSACGRCLLSFPGMVRPASGMPGYSPGGRWRRLWRDGDCGGGGPAGRVRRSANQRAGPIEDSISKTPTRWPCTTAFAGFVGRPLLGFGWID